MANLFAPAAELAAAPIGPSPLLSPPPLPAPGIITGEAAQLRALWKRNRGSMLRFIQVVLGERRLWSKQEEVCHSIDRYHTTLIPAGNSVGKSFLLGRAALAFLLMHEQSLVITNSPSQHQLVTVLWKEIQAAIDLAPIPLGLKITGSAPISCKIAPNWFALGHVSNKIERLTGHHAGFLLALIDEGSGVADPVYEALWSLNPSHVVVAGNPLNRIGRFYELCKTADAERAIEAAGGAPRTMNLIRIPSTSSPDIDKERSKYGMADQNFLRTSRRDYGENSPWWQSHVDALFPDSGTETVVPEAWLVAACQAVHVPGGFRRLAIDVATGKGGDDWVFLVRDQNGVLDLRWSNTWTEREAANLAVALCRQWGIPGYRVSWDQAGPGEFFGNTLAAAGIDFPQGYYGGAASAGHPNLRSACAQQLRWRLDPGRMEEINGVYRPQIPFSFNPARPDWHPRLCEVGKFKRQLEGKTYRLEGHEEIRERLKKSPDTADCFFQSWAFVA